jgi:hypothetical protein
MDVRTELAAASPDLPSVEVLTYKLSLRCGVLFPELSRLLNQEDALSAPCSPRAPSRGARNAADRLDPSLLMSHYGLLPNSSRRRALMSCRWLAALARVEGTDARPSRAVVKTALTCGFLIPK